jgi:hypothetical protein
VSATVQVLPSTGVLSRAAERVLAAAGSVESRTLFAARTVTDAAWTTPEASRISSVAPLAEAE